MFPGSELDNSCWYCGKRGHRYAKCFQPINFKVFASRKASFLQNEQKGRIGTKRVLHEMAEWRQELMDMDNSDAEDSLATTFFQDSAEDGSSSEEDVKDIGHTHADIDMDDNDSDF